MIVLKIFQILTVIVAIVLGFDSFYRLYRGYQYNKTIKRKLIIGLILVIISAILVWIIKR